MALVRVYMTMGIDEHLVNYERHPDDFEHVILTTEERKDLVKFCYWILHLRSG